MPAIVADQRRQGMAIKPDQRPPGIARQAQQPVTDVGTLRRCIFHGRRADILCADWVVPEQGTYTLKHLRHTVLTLHDLLVAVQQVAMDDAYLPGYHFMTLE